MTVALQANNVYENVTCTQETPPVWPSKVRTWHWPEKCPRTNVISVVKKEYDQVVLKYFIRLVTSYNWAFFIQREWLLYQLTSYNYFITCCNTITNCFIIKCLFFQDIETFHFWRNLSKVAEPTFLQLADILSFIPH